MNKGLQPLNQAPANAGPVLSVAGSTGAVTGAQIAADASLTYLQKFDPFTSLYNANATNTRKIRAAIALAKSGGKNAHIGILGDSVIEGYYSTAPFQTSGWPARLRTLLDTRMGIAAGSGIIWPFHWGGAGRTSVGQYDTRITMSGSTGQYWGRWDQSGPFGANAAGGGVFCVGNASATLTATATTDQFIVYYWKDQAGGRSLAGGTIAVNMDSVAQTAINCSGLLARATATYTPASQGSHTLDTLWSSGGDGLFLGMEFRLNGGVGGIRVSPAGISGTIAADALDTTYTDVISPMSSLYDLAAPDLTIITHGINEFDGASKGAQTSPTSWTASLQTHITRAKTVGDVMILLPYNSGRAATGGAYPWSQYVTAAYALADSSNIPLLDLTDYFGSYATANSLGVMFDTLHPNDKGHQFIADRVFAAVSRVSGL